MSTASKGQASDKIFEGHIRDLVASAEYEIRISEFLSPLEQRLAFDIACSEGAGQRCFFWGGVPEAERRRMVMIPDWLTPEKTLTGSAFELEREEALREIASSGADSGSIYSSCTPLEISASGYAELEHRDYLGSILALGLERSVVGDIAVCDAHSAIVFVSSEAAKLLMTDLTRVKNDAVKIKRAELEASFRIPRAFEVLTDTVMSARLDGIVKALCKITREEASDLVEKGDVTLNYITETRTDRTIVKGDVLSIRGHGKFIYDGDRGVNRRGRLRIDARKYV